MYSNDFDSVTNNLRNSANGTFVTFDDFLQSTQLTFDFFMELQRVESWEDVPLEFRRSSIDSVKVSVALRRFDPS